MASWGEALCTWAPFATSFIQYFLLYPTESVPCCSHRQRRGTKRKLETWSQILLAFHHVFACIAWGWAITELESVQCQSKICPHSAALVIGSRRGTLCFLSIDLNQEISEFSNHGKWLLWASWLWNIYKALYARCLYIVVNAPIFCVSLYQSLTTTKLLCSLQIYIDLPCFFSNTRRTPFIRAEK